MPLTGIHLLLSYQCTYECDHCFVWSSPRADGTMRLETLLEILDQAAELGTIEEIYFEGGEPFLFYPMLVEGLRHARARGFRTGVVTNCYWATDVPDAMLWLGPLKDLAVADLSVSSDTFHAGEVKDPRPDNAVIAAEILGLDRAVITIDPPTVCVAPGMKGEPIVGGSVRFRGRAAATLTDDLPRRPWTEFDQCPDEDFLAPSRVHVDGFGHVHLCQGVLLGNLNSTPLIELMASYDPRQHPIVGALVAGGPAELVRRFGVADDDGSVDACHLCYRARCALRRRYPDTLGPPQVYGVEAQP